MLNQGKELLFYQRCQKTLTLACYQRFMNHFASNSLWWEILLKSTFYYQSMWPWSLFGVTGVGESKNCCTIHFIKFGADLNRIWYVGETCWSDESHTHAILFDQCSREITLLVEYHHRNFITGFHSDVYGLISFKLGVKIEALEFYMFVPVWMTLSLFHCIGPSACWWAAVQGKYLEFCKKTKDCNPVWFRHAVSNITTVLHSLCGIFSDCDLC